MTRLPFVSEPATCSANSRHTGTQEERLAVLPLVRLTVERAGGRRDGEVRDREPVLRVPQLGVGREVTHDGDDGFAGHRRYFAAFSADSTLRGAAALRRGLPSERLASAAT